MSEFMERQAERIVLAHGGGGELTKRLLAERIVPRLTNDVLAPLGDAALLPAMSGRLCLTTDAFVVQPLEFPGGDIGRLAICGTVNDLAVEGATPRVLSLALVIEEGLSFDVLDRILDSIATTAQEAGVVIGTGDTKVIERRGGDGLMITTSGVGELRADARLDIGRIEPGDAVLINGGLAEHGLAVMSAREGLAFETDLRSDAAPLNSLIAVLLESGADVRFLRDPTRGGVAGVLADLAEETGCDIEIDETALPLTPVARHTAELLGLDPLTVANEGKCVAVVEATDAERALEAWRGHPLGRAAAIIGRVVKPLPMRTVIGPAPEGPAVSMASGVVELVTDAGGRRIVQRPYGEDLPRIC